MRMTKKVIVVLVTVCTFLAPHKTHAKNKQIIKRITKKATSRIGAKYVYGASHTKRELRNKNQKRFDCSGFVSWVYYQSGRSIGVITSSRQAYWKRREKKKREKWRHLSLPASCWNLRGTQLFHPCGEQEKRCEKG